MKGRWNRKKSSEKLQGKSPSQIYEMITQRIVSELEAGVVPWHQPWKKAVAPRSLATGKVYQGINFVHLSAMGYSNPWWLTYRKAELMGGHVKGGEHSVPAVYWKCIVRDDKDGNKKAFWFTKYDNVFNLEQTEGVEGVPDIEQAPVINPIEECERILLQYPNPPHLEHRGDRAYYHPTFDKIVMPRMNTFDGAEEYYSTRFHEAIHSTGHGSRLNRKSIVDAGRFGDENYSEEELIAEIGAAFLCGCAEIENNTVNNSVAYIGNWLTRLKNDKTFIVRASSKAQKAASFILNIKEESKREDSEILEEDKAA